MFGDVHLEVYVNGLPLYICNRYGDFSEAVNRVIKYPSNGIERGEMDGLLCWFLCLILSKEKRYG